MLILTTVLTLSDYSLIKPVSSKAQKFCKVYLVLKCGTQLGKEPESYPVDYCPLHKLSPVCTVNDCCRFF